MAITVEQAKKLINNPSLADKEIEELVSSCRMMAEVLFEKWQTERRTICPITSNSKSHEQES